MGLGSSGGALIDSTRNYHPRENQKIFNSNAKKNQPVNQLTHEKSGTFSSSIIQRKQINLAAISRKNSSK